MDVERLRLVDEGTPVGGHVDDRTLRDLPDGLVDRLEVGRDLSDVLNRALASDDPVAHLVVPEAELDQITEQPRADDLELAGEDTTRVDVRGVRLEALVVAEDLRGRSGRHRSKK